MPPTHRTVPRYPVSWTNRQHVRKADLRRDLEELIFVLETGAIIYGGVDELRGADTSGYVDGAEPVFIAGLGVFQWDPESLLADDGTYVIKPDGVSGAGRWVRPWPATQVNGVGTPGTRLYALADHVHPMNIAGGALAYGTPVAVGTVNADGVSVEVSRADHVHAHGDLPGGTLHAEAIAGGAAGFISGTDKTKLDGVASGATNTPLGVANPADLGITSAGVATNASREDHVHAHGDQGGGSQHLEVTTLVAGFMSASDKLKLDGISAGAGGFLAPIDTLVNLAAMSAGGLPDGTEIYVNEVEDIYVLEKAGSHTVDGVTVLAATGGGYWVARMHGRWDDMQGSIGQGAGAAALTVEVFRDTPFLMWFMRNDQNDALNFVYQFSHAWDYLTAVYPHLHIMPVADPLVPETARFDGYYVWTRPNYAGAPLPALSGWTAFGPIDVPINPGDIYVQKIIPLGTVTPPVWARESSSLLIWFRRFGTSPGDTYNTNKVGGTPQANLGILSTDVHYRKNKIGSETEIPT